ncbi:amino acid permease [Actinoplanes sp. NPDC051851]|uniref:APC family permease n=1 Tax=Actinoplanes sp. NPDC051851 TaxID=3154753 RepID=UPI00342861BE
MRLNGSVAAPDAPSPSLAPGRIGSGSAAFFGVAAAVPIATLVTLVPPAFAGGAGPLLPLSVVAVTLVAFLFSTPYARSTRKRQTAAPAYTYVSRGLGRPAGLSAAWLALAGYHAIQFGLYAMLAPAAAPLLRSLFGIAVPWWAVAGTAWLLVTLLGPIRAEITAGLIALLATAQGSVLAMYAVSNVLRPADGHVTPASILPGDLGALDRPLLGLLLAAAALAFAGFETAACYTEEAFYPHRAGGRGTVGAVLLIALLLGGLSWSMIVAAGPSRIDAAATANGSDLLFALSAERLVPWAVTLGRLMLVAGLFTGILALHHAITRYLYALGRERILPGVLEATGRRTGAPRAASLTQSLIAGAALLGAYAAGATTEPHTARWLVLGGALGILLTQLLISLATVLDIHRGGGILAPALATVSLAVLAYLAFVNLPALLDVRPGAALTRVLPAAILACALIGVVQALLLRTLHPVRYAAIALAGTAVVVTPRSTPHALPSPTTHAEPRPTAEPFRIPRQRTPGAHRPDRIDHPDRVDREAG